MLMNVQSPPIQTRVILPSPPSPSFQDAIREPPRSLAALLEVLLPRLQPRAEVRGVSLQDQQSFVSLCCQELLPLRVVTMNMIIGSVLLSIHFKVLWFQFHNHKCLGNEGCPSLQVSILVGELASQFSVLQHQVDDPFLVRMITHGGRGSWVYMRM